VACGFISRDWFPYHLADGRRYYQACLCAGVDAGSNRGYSFVWFLVVLFSTSGSRLKSHLGTKVDKCYGESVNSVGRRGHLVFCKPISIKRMYVVCLFGPAFAALVRKRFLESPHASQRTRCKLREALSDACREVCVKLVGTISMMFTPP